MAGDLSPDGPVVLGRVDRDQLPRAHAEAFSDYAVDMSYMTEERIRVRAAKNGVSFDLSVGAYHGERLVGFTLIGIGQWQGRRAAFDAGTGIVPGFRGRGLAGRMLHHALPRLGALGYRRFVLEVLQSNRAAIHAYRKAGFEITRQLACFELAFDSFVAGSRQVEGLALRAIERRLAVTFRDATDWQPSWENDFPAIERIPGELLSLGAFHAGNCIGILVYAPPFGWIMSLLVRRAFRRRGVASALTAELVARLRGHQSSVKLLNVDRSDSGMIAFLTGRGFESTVDQYEMSRDIEARGT